MQTIPDHFLQQVHQQPDRLALWVSTADAMLSFTWQQLAIAVARQIEAFQQAGLKSGDCLVTICPNQATWIVQDLAALFQGLVHVALSPELPIGQIADWIAQLQPQAISCDEQVLQQSLRQHLAIKQLLMHWLEVAPVLPESLDVTTWQQQVQQLMDCAARLLPDQAATIVLTSGTTGTPTGVVLTQGNLATNAVAIAAAFVSEPLGRRLCWLPLHQLYARTADLYCWIVRGSELVLNTSRRRILDDAQQTQPELINGVPYFYDKLRRHAWEQGWNATECGPKLRALLGGKVRLLIAGGAALPLGVLEFFAQCELPLVAGYGLTEAGPVVATETLAQRRAGSVGKPLPGVDVQIDSQGQILVRGPSIMPHYWQQPTLTAERLVDGWLQTGDLGYLDGDGFLFVTGRKKEVLVLSTGQKIAPAVIENELLDLSLVQQVLIHGEGRPYLTALIVPNPVALRALIRQHRLWVWSRRRALTHRTVLQLLRIQFQTRLAHRSAHEQITKFVLLGQGWTPESGELTASLKLKRDVIEQNYANEITALYDQ